MYERPHLHRLRRYALALALGWLAGCGPAYVRMLDRARPPIAGFIEIVDGDAGNIHAIAEIHVTGSTQTTKEIVDSMREEARKVGCTHLFDVKIKAVMGLGTVESFARCGVYEHEL